MATLHAAPGELIDIHRFEDLLPQATSTTVARTEHSEFFHLVLPAGKKLPQHQAASVITVQCIEGAIGFEIHGHSQLMRPGARSCECYPVVKQEFDRLLPYVVK
jgi:hypothetical protein